MAHGDGAAIDVHPVVVDVEGLHVTQDHGGEGLIEFEKIDIGKRHSGLFQELFGHIHRAGEHQRRIGADIGECLDAGAGLDAHRLAARLRTDQHGGSAIDDAGRIAGVVDVVDALDFRVGHDADGFEAAHFTRHLEGRIERGQRLHVGAGAHMLVAVEDRQAV